jgi:hypothetical protein
MNKEMIKNNVYAHVVLQPPAIRLDKNGIELPAAVDDDWWQIQSVTDDGVTISEPRSGHFRLLGYDHIKKFTSDGVKNGNARGFLTLQVQLYVQGNEVRLLPTRPGEPLPPPRPVVADRLVEFNYPVASKIQERLEAAGYTVGWARPERLASIELEGGQRVVERDAHGNLSMFHLRDGLVLVKKRRIA